MLECQHTTIEWLNHCVAAKHAQGPAGQKVVLHIHDDQSITLAQAIHIDSPSPRYTSLRLGRRRPWTVFLLLDRLPLCFLSRNDAGDLRLLL